MSSTTDIYTVYQIKNLVNSKVYIGITTKENPIDRWNEHLKNYLRYDYVLYKAMRKYGLENFQFSIIEQTLDLKEIKLLERKYIQEYNSYCFQENSNGYNMTLGGDGTFGFEHSQETKRKISKSNKGKTRIFTEDHKRKMSEARRGKILSKETRKKISEARKGSNNPMYGKTRVFTEETKRKMSEARKGSNNPMYGKTRTHSKKIKRKISESLKKYHLSTKTP
jgi:group I intron endonuclease